MNFKRLEEIFSKECISTRELQELFGISMLQNASTLMRKIKQATGDRLGIKGYIHVNDYFKYFGIETSRYEHLQSAENIPIPQSIHPNKNKESEQ